ncbi:unnamed protein product [Victoria cruziana]
MPSRRGGVKPLPPSSRQSLTRNLTGRVKRIEKEQQSRDSGERERERERERGKAGGREGLSEATRNRNQEGAESPVNRLSSHCTGGEELSLPLSLSLACFVFLLERIGDDLRALALLE